MDELFDRYFWLLGLAGLTMVTAVHGFQLRAQMAAHPDRAGGYRRLLIGFWLFMTLPWMVIGAGMLSGAIPDMNAVYHPRDGNPFVLACWGTVLIELSLVGYWVLARGGADYMFAHPEFFRGSLKSAAKIRQVILVMILAGFAGVAVLFFVDLPPVGHHPHQTAPP